MIIGLVGYPGSGKSFVSKLMSEFGYEIIDADKIGHVVLESIKDQIAFVFGHETVNENGVDRKALADIVFKDSKALNKLNSMVHPEIVSRIKVIAKTGGNKVIEAALLYETGLDSICDEVWFVDVPFTVRLERVKSRGWDDKELLLRELHFIPEDELRNRVDVVIDNVGPKERVRDILGACI